MITVSQKEFAKGWARARSVYNGCTNAASKNNAHRLLLFYAVENGLKSLIMRKEGVSAGDVDFSAEKHDLNRLLDRVMASSSLKLPVSVRMKSDPPSASQRSCRIGDVNQMWRYGCVAESPSDSVLEAKLEAVAVWIDAEIGGG